MFFYTTNCLDKVDHNYIACQPTLMPAQLPAVCKGMKHAECGNNIYGQQESILALIMQCVYGALQIACTLKRHRAWIWKNWMSSQNKLVQSWALLVFHLDFVSKCPVNGSFSLASIAKRTPCTGCKKMIGFY